MHPALKVKTTAQRILADSIPETWFFEEAGFLYCNTATRIRPLPFSYCFYCCSSKECIFWSIIILILNFRSILDRYLILSLLISSTECCKMENCKNLHLKNHIKRLFPRKITLDKSVSIS